MPATQRNEVVDQQRKPVLQACGLTKYYGRILAIENVSFSVAKGETVGLLGTNGSGKTTTMRILTGYMPPTSGTAAVAGRDLATASLEARRYIGYLPESVPLYADLTAADSLRFFGRLRGMGARYLAQRVDYVLEAFGLDGYRDVLVGKLSKGYRQRLGLAQAVLHEPDVLVLDEPTVSIDPIQVVEARNLIRRLGKDHTVLLSTHQLSEAVALCERVVILHRAAVVAEGRPEGIARSLRGEQRLCVEIRGPVDQATAVLEGVTGGHSVGAPADVGEGTVAFEVTAPAGVNAHEQIASRVVDAGLGLRALSHAEPDLEEAFLRLTEQERGDAGHA